MNELYLDKSAWWAKKHVKYDNKQEVNMQYLEVAQNQRNQQTIK